VRTPTDIRVPQRRVEHCMGTVFSIDVRGSGAEASVIDEVIRWLHWVDNTFSTYRPASQIRRLDRGELHLRDCAPAVREVLDHCTELTRETNGYFSARAGGPLDPSGYVKGWAIEKASELLIAAGSTDHCINGGGDVQCTGESQPGQPWRIGVAHPHRRNTLVGVASGNQLAVATSGTAERGRHILDPVRSEARGDLASVTLVGPRLSLVDAYATAAFAMGEAAPDWIASLPNISGLVVYADGTEWISGGEPPAAAGTGGDGSSGFRSTIRC
jgi:thiamine biosynthesis lipoprotein